MALNNVGIVRVATTFVELTVLARLWPTKSPQHYAERMSQPLGVALTEGI